MKTKDTNAQNLSLKRWAGKSKKYRKAVGLMLAKARAEKAKEPKCVECGCTNERACKGGCEWIEAPNYGGGKFWVCSKCK